jgi:diguanylate cyclase (GGDEF)-like protein
VCVLQWIKLSVARQAGVIVAGSLSVAALFIWILGRSALLPALPMRVFMLGLACVLPAAALFTAWVTERLVGSRLAHLAEVIDGAGPHDDLARIRDLGADEVGMIGHAVNRLLARITSIRASMIDQARQLGEAQRELELKARLSEKTHELSQRLEERAMLFEILRITSSSPELSEVLRLLVERVGQMLRMREVVIFLHDDELDVFAVQATYGFKRVDALRGRSLKIGEGIAGSVGQTLAPHVIEDVSKEEGYLGFWGEAERSGSLAAVPISHRDKLLGVLTVTRPDNEPITDVHLKLLCAIADNAALAIRNAQLFTRMRELSTHDEVTGLANQRHLRSHLEREIDRARRFEKPFALLKIEIDQLHRATEQPDQARLEMALRDVAALLSDSVRKVDTLARTAEGQFTLLLPRSDLREALQAGEKLRKAIAAHPFFDVTEQPPNRLTASIGVAQLSGADDEHGDSLTERAAAGLQAARLAGRNRVCSAEPLPAPVASPLDSPRLERIS